MKSGNMSRMLGTFAIFDHPFNRVFFIYPYLCNNSILKKNQV
ncbi:hypothetical protein CU024_0711 [Enterococcus faecium]|nr:hypothetical protein [Enterococcus faecium]